MYCDHPEGNGTCIYAESVFHIGDFLNISWIPVLIFDSRFGKHIHTLEVWISQGKANNSDDSQ